MVRDNIIMELNINPHCHIIDFRASVDFGSEPIVWLNNVV